MLAIVTSAGPLSLIRVRSTAVLWALLFVAVTRRVYVPLSQGAVVFTPAEALQTPPTSVGVAVPIRVQGPVGFDAGWYSNVMAVRLTLSVAVAVNVTVLLMWAPPPDIDAGEPAPTVSVTSLTVGARISVLKLNELAFSVESVLSTDQNCTVWLPPPTTWNGAL